MRVVAEEAFRKDRKFNSQSPQTQYALNPLSSSTPCANPNQPLTSCQRPLLFGVSRDLMRVTARKCTITAIRIWKTTPLPAPSQCLIHTNPRSAAPATSPNSAAPLDTPHSAQAAGANTPHPATLERKHPVDARQQLWPQISRRVSYPRDYGPDQFGQPLFYSSPTDWKAAHP